MGALLWLVILAAQLEALKPVENGSVSGTTLSLPELNFSVDAPSPEWRWLQTETQTKKPAHQLFVCQNETTGGRMGVMVFKGYWKPFDAQAAERFMAGSTEPFVKRGWRVDDVRHESATLQLPDAHHYRYRLTAPDGTLLYGYRYSLTAGRLYAFEALSVSAEEPTEFLELVRSFRVLHAPPEDPAQAFGMLLMVAYFVLLGICRIGAGVVNRITGRSRWDGWKIGSIVIVALTVMWGVYCCSWIPDDMPAFQQGETFGAMVL